MAARYFLLSILFIGSCLVAGQSQNYALKGGKVSLKPVLAGHPDAILWKYNGNKVVEFDGQEEAVYSPYDNRITLGWQTAELNISDLRFEDSGDYELDADINKRLHRSLYTLEVIEKVAKPTITCEMNDEGRSNTSGKLLCSAELSQPQPLMKFEWRTQGKVQPGPQLQISLRDKHDDEVYSCTVSNRLSTEMATFTAKDCYPEAEESSSALLIALLVTVVTVLLLVGLAILYCKRRHKAPAYFAKDAEERLTPGRTEAQGDERRALVHRASTLPSTQRLGHFVQGNGNTRPDEPASNQREDADSEYGTVKDKRKKTALLPPTGVSSPLDLNNLAGDAAAEQHREPSEEKEPRSDPSDSGKDNEPEPAVVSDDFSEDTQSSPKSPDSPEHPAQ
ncbi:signaling lymphocytic activation molecule-like [Lycodopsis pacificus]